jgi:hypothetical protein
MSPNRLKIPKKPGDNRYRTYGWLALPGIEVQLVLHKKLKAVQLWKNTETIRRNLRNVMASRRIDRARPVFCSVAKQALAE